jgi:hypothetical protein
MTGAWPKHQVDHINGMRRDNRWKNLRAATNAQNSRNRRPGSNNTSGRIGVYAQRNRWCACIGIDGKTINLGCFSTFSAAVEAREKAEAIHYGDFAPGVADAA